MNMDPQQQPRLKGIVYFSFRSKKKKKKRRPPLKKKKNPDFIPSPEVRGCKVEELARSGGG